ncbi:MAG: transcription elongation factor GreA, partial [Alphaproteobacteria bacterium]|nr:transcription elongation factor GreA [Alphaproteobacteria bacterium]
MTTEETIFPMTAEGYKKLEERLKDLKTVQRPAIIAAIEAARSLGDLSENAEYNAAREQQSFIEGHIKELEDAYSRAKVMPSPTDSEKVLFGSQVTLLDEQAKKKISYRIVGHHEADLENGFISFASPLGK